MEVLLSKNHLRDTFRKEEAADNERLITERDNGVLCKRCGCSFCIYYWIGGYMNPSSATICRDCNNLLKGNEQFQYLLKTVY